MKAPSSYLILLVLSGTFWSRHQAASVLVHAQLAVNLSIVHINDHHSNMDELTMELPTFLWPEEIRQTVNDTDDEGNERVIRIKYGSFPRVVSLMQQMSSNATDNDYEVLRLHAGDAITGTNYFVYFNSTVDAAVLNLARLDAMTIGNHEFDRGDTFLAEFITRLTFPVLSANVVPHTSSALINPTTGRNLFRPYTIKTLTNGEQVGICGITTKAKTELSSFPDPGTTVRLEVETATECAQNLTALGVNKIVLLTHIGYDNDVALMTSIPGVDVIVGGDSHTLLGDNATFSAANLFALGPYATMVGHVCIVQAWEYGKIVGQLNVQFDANGNVTSCSGTPQIPFGSNGTTYQIGDTDPPVYLDATQSQHLTHSLVARGIFANVTADPVVAAVIAPFAANLSVSGARVIGTANTSICHSRGQQPVPLCPNRELVTCLGGGGVCYLVAQGFLTNVRTADFAIQNSGGCRTDIPQGDITFASLFLVLPFANTLVTLNLTGFQIQATLEDAVNFFLDDSIGGKDGSYPFAAGLRWHVNYSAPFGGRFTNLEMNRRLVESTWTPLDMNATYTVVTNSFLGQGRDGYFTFVEPDIKGTYVDTGIEYAQSFINFIEAENVPINDPPLPEFSTQRMTFLNGSQCDAVNGVGPDEVAPIGDPGGSEAWASFSSLVSGLVVLTSLAMM